MESLNEGLIPVVVVNDARGWEWCEFPGLFISYLDNDPSSQVDRPCLVTFAYCTQFQVFIS